MTLLVLVLGTEGDPNATVAVIFLRIRIDNCAKRSGLLWRCRSHHDRLLVQRCGIVLLFFALIRKGFQRRNWSVQHDAILLILMVLDVEYLHLFLLLLLVGKQRHLRVVRGRFVALLDDNLDDRFRSFQVHRLVVVDWLRWLVVVHRVGDVTLES